MKHVTAVAILWALLAALAPSWAAEPDASIKATTLLKTATSWNGASLAYPQGPAEITSLLIELAPGGETGWHHHLVPSFGYVLEGELQVRLDDGSTKRLKAGDALAEVVGTSHNGTNVGKGPVKIVVFYAGTVGGALTVKQPPK